MDTYQKEERKRREKILVFWNKHGLEATWDAYKVSRPTLYRWKKKSTPQSRKHRNGYVHRSICFELEKEIIRWRSLPETCRLGKGKLLPLLEEYCTQEHIDEVLSESRVGRILTDLKQKGKFPDPKKLRLDARTGKLHEKKKAKTFKLRRARYLPEHPGDLLQIDGVTSHLGGARRYTFTAVDVVSRWTFSRTYTSASSRNGADYLSRLLRAVPFSVSHIQTDNGSEFLALFQDAAQKAGIIQFFNWPRKPIYQGWVESFNGTLKEEFISWHRECLADSPADFNDLLNDWTI